MIYIGLGGLDYRAQRLESIQGRLGVHTGKAVSVRAEIIRPVKT